MQPSHITRTQKRPPLALKKANGGQQAGCGGEGFSAAELEGNKTRRRSRQAKALPHDNPEHQP
ncbi:hypothetical protein ATOBIA_N03020 [Atopobiaceae bacterium P1]|jgi:hypothetical protein|uniref:Uncharacterized protein n=1 Tax=Leptogranulimonas caecicola TaxID=2894156 RepID=A0AAU9CLH2_9ACTN|nr:hypothetical protein ATOBIA_N03020 [Atopobiaceae bacterium P1]BDC90421.1 hypothetical protein ATTO_02930 [Leptogranulimonas caecicola]